MHLVLRCLVNFQRILDCWSTTSGNMIILISSDLQVGIEDNGLPTWQDTVCIVNPPVIPTFILIHVLTLLPLLLLIRPLLFSLINDFVVQILYWFRKMKMLYLWCRPQCQSIVVVNWSSVSIFVILNNKRFKFFENVRAMRILLAHYKAYLNKLWFIETWMYLDILKLNFIKTLIYPYFKQLFIAFSQQRCLSTYHFLIKALARNEKLPIQIGTRSWPSNIKQPVYPFRGHWVQICPNLALTCHSELV